MPTRCEGHLSKFTNVMKGWQQRYFVLDSSYLHYYLSKEEHELRRRRGFQHVDQAYVVPSDEDEHTFVVHFQNNQIFRLRAKNAAERHQWVDAIRSAVNSLATENSVIGNNDSQKALINAEQIVSRTEHNVNELSDVIEGSTKALDEQMLIIKATSQAALFSMQDALQILTMLHERQDSDSTPVRRRQTESPLSTSSFQQRKSFSTRSMWSALGGSPKRSKKYNNGNNELNNSLSTSTGSLPAETRLALTSNQL